VALVGSSKLKREALNDPDGDDVHKAVRVLRRTRNPSAVVSPPSIKSATPSRALTPNPDPKPGDFVEVRSRPWLVEAVDDTQPDLTTVRLSCIADDAQGEQVEVLLDAEIGARCLRTIRGAGSAMPRPTVPRCLPPTCAPSAGYARCMKKPAQHRARARGGAYVTLAHADRARPR
jgi:hypothetical protein